MSVQVEHVAGCLDPASLVRFYQEELSQIAHELIQARKELHGVRDSAGWKVFESLHRQLACLLPARVRQTAAYKNLRQRLLDWLEPGTAASPRGRGMGPRSKMDPARGWDVDYDAWWRRHEPEQIDRARTRVALLPYRPRISVIMPVYNTDPELLARAVETVREQIYPEWELCICDDGSTSGQTRSTLHDFARLDPRIKLSSSETNQGIAMASNRALALASGEFIALMDHDDEIAPHALYEIANCLNEHPLTDFLYSDADKINISGRRFSPFFKPDWSPDLLLSCNYLCHLVVIRTNLMREVNGFRSSCEGSQDYDLFLRILERTDAIRHIPAVLYHWRATDTSTAQDGRVKMHAHVNARVALQESLDRGHAGAHVEKGHGLGLWRVRYPIPDSSRVSIIVPSSGNISLLERCFQGLSRRTGYENFETILVDNSTGENVAVAVARFRKRGIKCKYVDCRGWPFNFSRLNNRAVTEAEGNFLLFLNDDVDPCSPDWLGAMLEHACRQEVGAVGPMLLFRDKTVQHAGVVLGLNGCCDHGMKFLPMLDPGFHNFHNMIRNCSAVTGACLLTRKSVFEKVGGFDETYLPNAFQDVDLCLKIGAMGWRIVYTPFAKLYHDEGSTRRPCGLSKVAAYEEQILQQRWGKLLAADPYYSPHLSRSFPGYRVDATR